MTQDDDNTVSKLSRRRFLAGSAALGGSLLIPGLMNSVWAAGSDAPEKKTLRVGFIPLTDCAPVVMSPTDPRLIGCVHESDLLRSYIEEADRMRREDLGGVGLFAETARRTDDD